MRRVPWVSVHESRDLSQRSNSLGEPSRIAVVQAIQVFKAFAFEKLARGIGQANVDLT